MLEKARYTFNGALQDVTKSKHPAEYYFEGEHIRIVATDSQSTASVTNEKGNTKIFDTGTLTIDQGNSTITSGSIVVSYKSGNEIDQQITSGEIPSTTSGTQVILGHVMGRNAAYFITTDGNGFDVVWRLNGVLDGNYSRDILYVRNMNLSLDNPVQMIYNYENENIEKIYWVDGRNQIRFLNTIEEDVMNIPLNTINFVGDFSLSQPTIQSIESGGSHVASMVQYTYNLYRLNSTQTKLGPFSELIALTRGDNLGGGEVNENVSSTPVINIDNIDDLYTHIKIYRLRYTTLNATPTVEIIDEREIGRNNSVIVYDDGTNIGDISLEELLFLGSDPIIPEHIITKDNVMFPVNVTEKNFDVPEDFDMRAYSWNSTNVCFVYDNVTVNQFGVPQGAVTSVSSTSFNLPQKHDAVNLNHDTFKYQVDGTTLGGEGKYIKYEIVQKSLTNPEDYKLFKDNEIYRIGIQFYNKLGQVSFPKWIADIKAPSGNLQGNYNTLNVELKSEFTTFLDNYSFDDDNDRPVGYKIVRVNRTQADRSIIAQGILSSMMFQVKGEQARAYEQFISSTGRTSQQDDNPKLPTYLIREFQKVPNTAANDNNGVLLDTRHLAWLNDDPPNTADEGGEIYTVTNDTNKISQSFQYTKMMQMHSPDVMFDTIQSLPSDTNLRVLGLCQSTLNGVESEVRITETQLELKGGKTEGGINPFRIDPSNYTDDNDFRRTFRTPQGADVNNNDRFIGPFGWSPTAMGFYQFYRQFNTFISDSINQEYGIYGTPELTVRGAGNNFYNNDPRYTYTNSFQSFSSDGEDDDDCDNCDPITSINSFGNQCLTIMLGTGTDTTNARKSLEDLYNDSSLVNSNGVLLTEIVRDNLFIYAGGMYGGNTYEDKTRNNYIEIGSYQDITTTTIQIDSPGDTFVQNYRFMRVSKTDTEVYDHRQVQSTEIVEFPVETTIDLKNRHDISISAWDSRFQPQESEYHGYNSVYSQQPTVIQNTDEPFNFNAVEAFDTRITATKTKTPNETIDSWTDLLVNEEQDLDGKYGPINGVLNHRDDIYIFQDEAVAKLIINPRVQVQGTNGLDVELGRGTLLYDYQYLTTKSGSINKWAITETKTGFYYYDALNKGLFRFPDNMVTSLSDAKGMHTFFNNNYDYAQIVQDNPIQQAGAVMAYDNYNNDIYLTVHQGEASFTRVFNELRGEFIDKKLYYPTWYMNKGERLFATNAGATNLWEQGVGEYNKFFDSYIPSTITLQVNPAVDLDCIFHNIMYKSEIYLSDIDQPQQTLTHIRAYNEYQDSGRIPLIVGRNSNVTRRFRDWKADIPRELNSRNKMRNPWIFLKLELDNQSNYKMILHDIIIQYNIY